MTGLQHGLPATYKRHRCRCGPCRYAAAEQRRAARPHGDPVLIQAHVRALSAAGIGYRRTAELAGVTTRTLWRIVYDGVRPTAATADRILAVQLDAGPAQRWVSALGTARRLQALRAIGWSNVELSSRLGVTPTTASQVAMERRLLVRRQTAARTADVYAALSEVFPPMASWEARNRTFARWRSWFPPIAWDVETIDDPEMLPCLLPPVEPVDRDLELLVQHIVAGHPVEATAEAQREIVRRMPDRRPREVAQIARCDPRQVSHLRARLEAS